MVYININIFLLENLENNKNVRRRRYKFSVLQIPSCSYAFTSLLHMCETYTKYITTQRVVVFNGQ